jgi:hypothetical protein
MPRGSRAGRWPRRTISLLFSVSQCILPTVGERVRIERGPDGRLLAIKTARAAATSELSREAEVLRRAQVPGVVELVEDAPVTEPTSEDECVLVTGWVGPRTLAELDAPLGVERVAGLCLAVAATVGRLHRCGVVHGAIEASHVVLDRQGRPVLCGFGTAALMDGPSSPRPAVDVAGLGRLLLHLLDAEGGSVGPRRTRRRRRELRARRALLALGAAASVDDPSCRPSLAAYVHALRRAMPEARLGDHRRTSPATSAARAGRPRPAVEPEPRRPEVASTPGRTTLALVAVVTIGATTYFGLSAWWSSTPLSVHTTTSSSSATSLHRAPAPSPAPMATSTTIASTRPEPEPTTTILAGAPGSSALAPTAGGDAPPVVEHDGRRYAVGQPGDVALVGPWFCDGRDVVALLRPSNGSVHVFSDWAPAAGTLEARSVASVPGATGLTGVPDGPDCEVLVVRSGSADLRTLTAADLR